MMPIATAMPIDTNMYVMVLLWKFRVVMSDSSMTRPWTLSWTGSEDAVLPIPAFREKRRGERMREPNILLLGLTVANELGVCTLQEITLCKEFCQGFLH